MNETIRKFIVISIYAIAMAFMEAVVVAYIRELLYLASNRAELDPYAVMEVWREAATIIMLASVGWLTGRQKTERWAFGLFAFGLWDIWYYVWLKVLINWPKTLLDWDTLFLIPLPWRGPVLSAGLIAALICVTAALAIAQSDRGERPRVSRPRIVGVCTGAALALYTFMEGPLTAWFQGREDWVSNQMNEFNWPLFLAALALMAAPALTAVWPLKKR